MEGPVYKSLISFRSGNKHGCHRQFLFLVGRFLKTIFSSETAWPNEPTFGMKYLWLILYKVSSKQNERRAKQAQFTEPLVYIMF